MVTQVTYSGARQEPELLPLPWHGPLEPGPENHGSVHPLTSPVDNKSDMTENIPANQYQVKQQIYSMTFLI